MAVTITSTMPGANADYYRYLWNGELTKTDRYKDPTLLDFALVPWNTAFVKLTRGAYITVNTVKYPKWFTGYITNDPELEYIGKKDGHGVWGYKYQATSDDYILNLKPIGMMQPFMNMKMGAILKALVNKLMPGVFDVTNIADGPFVAQYVVEPDKKFRDVVQDFCESASYLFYARDKKLYFLSQDDASIALSLDASDKNFTPSRLSLKPNTTPLINDVTVLGQLEPQAYMHEYFVGTGLDAAFPLVGSVFGADSAVLLDDTFTGQNIDTSKWVVHDTVQDWLQVSEGYLNCLGGNGNFDISVQSVVPIPLDGRLRITHGDWDFLGGSGVVGGLWTQTPNSALAGCVYGFNLNDTTLTPIVQGVLDTDQAVTVSNTKRYVLRTLVEFTKANRTSQTFSFIRQDGSVGRIQRNNEADVATWNTLITEVDPSNGQIVQQWNIRHYTTVNASDAYATYAPLISDTLHATVTGITVSIPLAATLEAATQVQFTNTGFDEWSGGVPKGWKNAENVFEETTVSSVGSALKLDPGDSGITHVDQTAKGLIEPDTKYTVMCKVLRNPATDVGTLKVHLVGTDVDTTGLALAYSEVPTDKFAFVTATLTDKLATIPDDLVLRIEVTDGAKWKPFWVDEVIILSEWKQQLVGPNEVDAMDGLAPVATITTGNTGAETKSTYTGAPQYNPGQCQLVFFKDSLTRESNIPPSNQVLRLSYRAAGSALGRSVVRDSVNAEAVKWGDDGIRSIIRTDLSPRPRTSQECELAAAALAGESSFTHYDGSYTQFSDYFAVEPQAGAILKFLNFSAIADVQAEEVNEVTTTMESSTPTEKFLHTLSFGKPDHIRRLLSRFEDPKGTFQRSDTSGDPVAVDSNAVGMNFAPDVTKPYIQGWDDSNIYLDAGQDLGASGLLFEVRYTDEGWGVDDGKNLVTRITSRQFSVPRSMRGRVFFIRQANRGNLIKYSDDQSQASVYSGVTMTRVLEAGPGGNMLYVSSGSFTTNSVLSGSVTMNGASSHCFSFDVCGTAGKTVTATVAGTSKTFTLSGYWQRFSVSVSGAKTGAQTVSIRTNAAMTLKTTRWSVEENTLFETCYSRTTATLYGPVSRYSACLHVAFPVSGSVAQSADGDSGGAADPIALQDAHLESGPTFTQTPEGVWNWGAVFQWTNPSAVDDPNFLSARLYVQQQDENGNAAPDADGQRKQIAEKFEGGTVTASFSGWPIPDEYNYFKFTLTAVNKQHAEVDCPKAFNGQPSFVIRVTTPGPGLRLDMTDPSTVLWGLIRDEFGLKFGTTTPVNLVMNPQFEDGLEKWTAPASAAVVEGSGALSGSKYVSLNGNSQELSQEYFDVRPFDGYNLDVYFKTDADTNGTIKLYSKFFKADMSASVDGPMAGYEPGVSGPKTEWTKLSTTAHVPDGFTKMQVMILVDQNSTGKFYVDNVWCEKQFDVGEGMEWVLGQLELKDIPGTALADGALSTLNLFGPSFRPVAIVTDLPATNDPNYPDGCAIVVSNPASANNGKLFRKVDGAWSKALDGNDLLANSVTAGAIAAGAITASKLVVGNFDNLLENPGFEKCTVNQQMNNVGVSWSPEANNQWYAENITPVNAHSGNWYAVAQGVAQGAPSNTGYLRNNLVFECVPGDQFYVETYTRAPVGVTSGCRVVWKLKGGAEVSSTFTRAGDNTYHVVGGTATAPANAISGQFSLMYSGLNSGWILFDDCYVHKKVISAYIADAAIITATIKDANITNLKVAADLAADKIITGTLGAGVAYIGKVNASQVNAGQFIGCTLQMNLNNVTTYIDNTYDALWGGYAGVRVCQNYSNQRSIVTAGGLACITVWNQVGWQGCVVSYTGYVNGVWGNYECGATEVRRDGTVTARMDGYNGGVTGQQLCLQRVGYPGYFLWMDSSGNLRISRTEPAGNNSWDTHGKIIVNCAAWE